MSSYSNNATAARTADADLLTVAIPPSAELLPPASALRGRLAVALREVDLLRRLVRAAESVHPHRIITADRLMPPGEKQAKGGNGG